MDDSHWLAEQFERHRTHLRSVAFRMLGSVSEADDAVQEAWIRLARSDTDDVENLAGWLTTVVARVCLNQLASRRSRAEDPLGDHIAELAVGIADGADPEYEAMMADSVGLALLVVLERLTPSERLAFVLHDLFAMPFEEIAPIVERSPTAARQLASRARRRVQGSAAVPDPDQSRRREVVEAFLRASRAGDFDALLAVLDPNIVLRADSAAVAKGAPLELRGANAVATLFCGRARAARPALVNGMVGAVWATRGRPNVVFGFTIRDGRITGIVMLADPQRLDHLDAMCLGR